MSGWGPSCSVNDLNKTGKETIIFTLILNSKKMADLQSVYLGLKLKNPLIISSSGLTDQVSKIKKLEECGAGAVVLKSLFEEQILHEAGRMIQQTDYPGAEDYLKVYTRNHSVSEYLKLIEDAKRETRIPIIASVNCVTTSEWIDFSRNIEQAGADALELNIFYLPLQTGKSGSDYEAIYLDLASRVKETINIPLAVKLGQHFTHPAGMVEKLYHRGIKGVVLFNRFYEPDIDLEQMKFKAADVFSSPSELSHTLRWVGIVSSLVEKIDVAASTGVHDAEGVLKMILAGAKAVMMCSAIYKNGPEYIKKVLTEVNEWMKRNNIKHLDELRGKLSYARLENPAAYERAQFMKYFSAMH